MYIVFQVALCANKNLTGLFQLMAKLIFGNIHRYIILTHYSKRYKITDLKPKHFLAGENTSVLIILATT